MLSIIINLLNFSHPWHICELMKDWYAAVSACGRDEQGSAAGFVLHCQAAQCCMVSVLCGCMAASPALADCLGRPHTEKQVKQSCWMNGRDGDNLPQKAQWSLSIVSNLRQQSKPPGGQRLHQMTPNKNGWNWSHSHTHSAKGEIGWGDAEVNDWTQLFSGVNSIFISLLVKRNGNGKWWLAAKGLQTALLWRNF